MAPPREPPGVVEATAMAIAGPAFATSLLVLRHATPFGPGLFDAGAAVCLGLGFAPWVHRLAGAAWATMARGAALAIGTLLLSSALVAPFFGAVAPAAVAVAGGTLLQANARREKPSSTLDGFAGAALAVAFVLGLLVSSGFPEPDRMRLALVLALVLVAVGLALRRALLATRVARDLAPMPVGILLVGALVGAYAAYRPLVQQHVANLPLYEWTLAAGLASLALSRLRRKAKEDAVADAWSGDARRHAQDVRPVYDARMAPLAAATLRWLERGEAFEEYRAALEANGVHVPPSLAALGGRPRARRASRREAAAKRLAAHESLMSPRGPHGDLQSPVRAHP
jgi:hypothetical protein